MKHIKQYTAIGVLALLFFMGACIDYDYETPEAQSYAVDFEANTSIQELKAIYGDSLTQIEDEIIIKATVVANDRSGNYYKSIVIQDSTGAIALSLDAYELHNKYRLGDLLYIKCQGLFLGEYGGVVQLGAEYNSQVGRIEEPLIDKYIYKSDGGREIEPAVINFNQLTTARINTLVKFENVQFAANEIGGTYADGINQITYNRTLENCDGTGVIVRTSGYSDFANEKLPVGNGTFIGILGYHLGAYQLIIRDPKEIEMNNSRCGPVFIERFNSGLGQFTTHNIEGPNATWVQDAFGGVNFAKMTGYVSGSYEQSEDWLVSNAIDLTITENPALSFRHTINYGYYTNWEDDARVFISTNYSGTGDPTTADWTEITGYAMPPGNNWNFVNSGELDISDYQSSSIVFIAFVYTSPASNNALTWEIDWVKIENAE